MSGDTASLTLRMPTTLLQRIDREAERHGQTRTQYVVSWLPVAYDEPELMASLSADQNGRKTPANAR